MTRTGTSVRRHMGTMEHAFHATMILCTCGFWIPVYRRRKSKLERTTDFYS